MKTNYKPPMKYYFAYGSNLNIAQMERRCRDAEPVGKISLPNARLIFRGVADIEYDETDSVAGAIWRISPADERELDIYEGVKRDGQGLYVKKEISIRVTEHEGPKPALVYVMNQWRRPYGLPATCYYEVIAKGFDDFKLDRNKLVAALKATNAESKEHVARPKVASTALMVSA